MRFKYWFTGFWVTSCWFIAGVVIARLMWGEWPMLEKWPPVFVFTGFIVCMVLALVYWSMPSKERVEADDDIRRQAVDRYAQFNTDGQPVVFIQRGCRVAHKEDGAWVQAWCWVPQEGHTT